MRSQADIVLDALRDELQKEAAPAMLQIAKQVAKRVGPAVVRQGQKAVRGARQLTDDVAGAAQRFGARTRHGFTGHVPEGMNRADYLKKIRGGATDAQERFSQAQQAMAKVDPKVDPRAAAKATKELSTARNVARSAQTAQDMGLTSIPGYAKSIKQHGLGKTLKADLSQQWHEGGALGKAMIGLPVASAGVELAKPSQEGGPGRLRRAGKSLSNLGYAVGGPLPLLPQMVAGTIGGELASMPFKQASEIKFPKKKPPLLGEKVPLHPEEQGQTQPSERIMTPAAMGRPPGDVLS